jgi:hypothetical protein
MGCSHQGPGEGRKIRRPGANKSAEFRVPIKWIIHSICNGCIHACAAPAPQLFPVLLITKRNSIRFFTTLKLFHPRNYGTLRTKRDVQTLSRRTARNTQGSWVFPNFVIHAADQQRGGHSSPRESCSEAFSCLGGVHPVSLWVG